MELISKIFVLWFAVTISISIIGFFTIEWDNFNTRLQNFFRWYMICSLTVIVLFLTKFLFFN